MLDKTDTTLNLMERNTEGLRKVLLDEIDSLRNGRTSAKRAHAISRLASSTLQSVRVEVEVATFTEGGRKVMPVTF